MPWPYSALIPSLWGLWLLYWIIAANSAKPTQRAENIRSRLTHIVPLTIGGLLMGLPHTLHGLLDACLVPPAPVWLWCSTALVAVGLGFSVIARTRLGGNWSSVVTLKADHELIRSGPYRYVRHPIYSGLLLALLGTSFMLGTERALLGMALMTAAIIRKSIIEEHFLSAQFGESYVRYRAEVPALIPFVY
jgi:protein-S-isoprenylcysteine O-methyltransferase Ste14